MSGVIWQWGLSHWPETECTEALWPLPMTPQLWHQCHLVALYLDNSERTCPMPQRYLQTFILEESCFQSSRFIINFVCDRLCQQFPSCFTSRKNTLNTLWRCLRHSALWCTLDEWMNEVCSALHSFTLLASRLHIIESIFSS